jgi:alanine dehydrogenase
MKIGVPKEIKNHEFRVGLTPDSVAEIVAQGHEVVVETDAGTDIGAVNSSYEAVGAKIAASASEVFRTADMIVKVKEPQSSERAMLREGQILFTYLHLAPDPQQTAELIESGAVCIAYETVTDQIGGLPLLKPMSQVAGRMSIQAGATAQEKTHGGRGVLIGGVPGVAPAKVVIIGGGTVGLNAAQMAIGMHADVTIFDRNALVLEQLENQFTSSARILFSTQTALDIHIMEADIVIGAVLLPGAEAPKLVKRSMMAEMKPGSVIVDVAIDLSNVSAYGTD